MPLVHLYVLEGKTVEQKAAAIDKITQALVDSLGTRPDAVRVIIQDIPKTDWGIGGVSARELGR